MKSIFTFTALAFICTILSFTSNAATRISTTSGDFSSSSTWGGSTPAAGDSLVIPSGKTVTVSSSVDFRSGSATKINIVGGTLQMDNGKKMRLAASSYINLATNTSLITHGGGGNNTYIEVNGSIVWSANISSGVTGPITYPADALPVKLTSFEATPMSGFVSITWTTAEEINNDYFEVQRSTDMVNFTTISHTKGQGTTMNMTNYVALDEAPLAGTAYYRLVQVDFDGTTTLSKSVAVTTNNQHTPSLSIYPNPSTGVVNATLTSESASEAFSATVLVTDITGRVVATKLISELTSSAKVNLLDGTENLRAGFYSVTIINGTSTQTLKLQLLN
ncbi:MAG: T9SS type A sorting domain-containing protein [Bacteroidia bacterium]|nr:T9SS type A sorting domain-containing protein [Bacteroidia bacterium]